MKFRQSEPFIWWKHGVIYHIYPRSFKDSNGDGVGDLRGIISKLPYLSELGIDGIWLSPVFLSPMVDFGYDVADYREIDPIYGCMEDFKTLVEMAHALGIRVICDMILNHTSNQHKWFVESSSSKDNPKRDWYIWRDAYKGGPPNNWRSAAGGSAWEYDALTGQCFYHSFFKEQPDLNWRNPELSAAFFEELKFWMDMGVDGFRLDVINMIAKDKKFRDNPHFWGIPFLQQHVFTRNRNKSHEVVRKLRELVDQYGDKVLVGEIFTMPPGDSEMAARYLDEGKGMHMAFDFSLIFNYWNARKYYKSIRKWYSHIPDNGWPCHVLSNHDLFRSIDRFPWLTHKDEKAKVAAALLLTLKGTPFVYYGEEIGMRNGKIKHRDIQDPFGKQYWPFFTGRDKARTPMQWDSSASGGFTTGQAWLPVNEDAVHRNVEQQEKQASSLLHFYRALIHMRKKYPALQSGRWVPLVTGQRGILAYARIQEEERIVVILNFTGRRKKLVLPEHSFGYVILSTHRDQDQLHYFQDLRIFPYEATVYNVERNRHDNSDTADE